MKRRINLYILAILITSTTAVILYFLKFNNDFSNSSSDWGDFGSYLSGTFGVLITFASVILLYLTLNEQISYSNKQDISNQRQQFESHFFKLLETQRDIYKSFNGISKFEKTRNALQNSIKQNCQSDTGLLNFNFKSDDYKTLVEITNQTFGKIFVENSTYLSHYLRHLYTMINFVEKKCASDKEFYMSLIHSQMSDDELYISFYNAIAVNEPDYVKLLDKYHFFEDIISTGKIFESHANIFFPISFPEINAINDFQSPFGEYNFF